MKDEAFLARVEAHYPDAGVTIWFLGGPSIIVQSPKTTVYLDLFAGEIPEVDLRKATTDLLDPRAITRIDAALCTHHDPDHCHLPSLSALHAHSDALFIGPHSCTTLFRRWKFERARQVELATGEAFQLKDLRIWAQPCNDYFDPAAVSYVIQSGGVTLFDGGDTLFYSGYGAVGQRFEIDVALLNFARNPPGEIYYMNHAHVARTARQLGARILIPKHFDLWHEFLEDPQPLIPLLQPDDIDVRILDQGASLTITPEAGEG